jgi:hypothetical protein
MWCTVQSWQAKATTPLLGTPWAISDNDSGGAPPAQKKRKTTRGRKEATSSTSKVAEDLQVEKIKMKTTAEQRVELKKWFGAARYVYNQVVAYIQTLPVAPDLENSKEVNKLMKDLRDRFVCDDACSDKPWLLAVPYGIRDGRHARRRHGIQDGHATQERESRF